MKLKKCIFPRETLVFAAQILTQKMHIHLGGFLGWQKMQKKEFRNAKIGTILALAFPTQSLSDIYLKSIYLSIFVSLYLSIFLSIFLSIYLSIYLWQFDYLLTFDGSEQAAGHQISQNEVQDPKGYAFVQNVYAFLSNFGRSDLPDGMS